MKNASFAVATAPEVFTPVSVEHPVAGSQIADSQAKLDILIGMGYKLPVTTSTSTGNVIQAQRTQDWTNDFGRGKKILTQQNENRRFVPSDIVENDTFRAKCLRAKIVNEGKPDAYADTQVSFIGKNGQEQKTCIAMQDFHEIGLEITITAVPRQNGDGLRWNSSL